MIVEGLKLMVIGMAIVYVFLIVLMLLIILSSRIFKGKVMATPSSKLTSATKSADDLIAVLSAAISSYRNRKKGSN